MTGTVPNQLQVMLFYFITQFFYVGKDGLHFVFAEYSVAPYNYAPDMYGPVEVVIPAYGKYKTR